jgi:beta-galactosidase
MFLLVACVGSSTATAQRVTRSLDTDWLFHRGVAEGAEQPDFDASDWPQVDVPHDWSIAGPFDEDNPTGGAGGWLPAGVGWYRKSFTLPSETGGRRVVIELDGVMAKSDVWINGHHLGHRPNGYVSLTYDLTEHVRFGDDQPNVVAVRADNRPQPASRWYTGAGIYRHARLVMTDPLHVAPSGVFATTPLVDPQIGATVRVTTELVNDGDTPREFVLQTTLVDPAGNVVTVAQSPHTLAAGVSERVDHDLTLDSPQFWDIDNPLRYRCETRIIAGDETVDNGATSFGVRLAEFKSDTGFWLNGRNLKLKGVCLHHDGGAVGAAVPDAVWERRLRELKSLGVNAVRTAHNPVSPQFLDQCDKLGLLVMSEFFDCWTVGKNRHDYHDQFEAWHERDMQDVIRRDRNHPSIVLYSVGNEIRDTHREEHAKQVLGELVEICHREDPTRPVTQGLFRPNVTHDYDNGLADLLDVIGTNYRDRELLDAWRDDPSRKIIGTEQSHERSTWLDCRDNPQHAGQFLWVGIDYLGESRRWPKTSFNAGLLDRTGDIEPRGYERQSWWSDEPMVRAFRRLAPNEAVPDDPGYERDEWRRVQVLFPNWTPRRTEPHDANVEVYSNCDEVELFLNDQSLGTKTRSENLRPLTWRVPYEPGTLRAVARNDGEVVAEDVLRTAGEPAKIELSADRETVSTDWDEVVHITAEVVDAVGVRIPRTDQVIEFSVDGPGKLIAVDSGDVESIEPFQTNERVAFQGRALAIVRGTAAGTITVHATAEGLEAGKLEVPTVIE